MRVFSELPHEERMAYRQAIEDAGGFVVGYSGPYVQVAIPRDDQACFPGPVNRFYGQMKAAGLEYRDGSGHWFPLGSDHPPDHLRHDGRYPGSRGFWYYGLFYVP